MTPIAQIPPFLNSYRVVAALPDNRNPDVMIVLVHRPGHPVHEYLTAAWSPRCGDTWDCGDYHKTLGEAQTSLVERARFVAPVAGSMTPIQDANADAYYERGSEDGRHVELKRGAKPHDTGSAPPKGFTRYRIEVDVPDDEDPSNLLERVQVLATDMLDEHEPDEDEFPEGKRLSGLRETIENRASVQRMEG